VARRDRGTQAEGRPTPRARRSNLSEGWFDTSFDDEDWAVVRSDQTTGWESQGFPDYTGFGWYRQIFEVPDELAERKFVFLYFGAVDEDAWVYLNGQHVYEHSLASTGLTIDEIWLTPFAFDAKSYLEFGQKNSVAVRVYNSMGMGGVYKPVYLIGADRERHICSYALTPVSPYGKEVIMSAQDFKQQRKQLAHRQRRIIFNNDGCDIDRMEGPKPSDLLAVLTAPLVGSHVDTIFYCTCIGFTLFYHNTELGEILGLDSGAEHRAKRARMVRELIKQGTDPLEVMVDFGQRHDIEVFWSMRMNDEHDQWHPQIIPQFKKDHPEYLFGTQEDRPPHGPWTGVDYARWISSAS